VDVREPQDWPPRGSWARGLSASSWHPTYFISEISQRAVGLEDLGAGSRAFPSGAGGAAAGRGAH
jgi:hypothetical protein